MRLSRAAFVAIPLLLLCAGCQTGDVMMKVPISDGGEITVPLTGGGPKPGEADGYKVALSALEPGKENREAFYKFGLVCSHEPALRRIRVEDISDEKPALLIDDRDPKFTNRRWVQQSEVIAANDPRFQWIFQITMSMRVYKFTLTRADGTEVSFNQVTVYPPYVKAMVRNKWGEKY